MKAVRQISTGRLVWREIPDFEEGYGIINAAIDGYTNPADLEEIDITEEDWEAEGALRYAEQNPTNVAYKASVLYGMTHEELDTYINNNVTDLASAREFVRKMAHVVLWLVKKTRMDE